MKWVDADALSKLSEFVDKTKYYRSSAETARSVTFLKENAEFSDLDGHYSKLLNSRKMLEESLSDCYDSPMRIGNVITSRGQFENILLILMTCFCVVISWERIKNSNAACIYF
jgi:hypothetical protein